MPQSPLKIALDELLQNIELAKQRMSRRNSHRLLFSQCQDALIQLATRVGEHSASKDEGNAPTEAQPVGR